MKREKIQDKFLKQPYYEGGDKALKDFITQNLRYPSDSFKSGVEGDVHLRYDIDYKGVVTDVKIIGGPDQHCNDEAIRLVKLLRFIVPKTPRHLKVTFHKTITIHFRINQSNKIVKEDTTTADAHQSTLSYSFVPHQPVAKPEFKKPEMYNYIIKI